MDYDFALGYCSDKTDLLWSRIEHFLLWTEISVMITNKDLTVQADQFETILEMINLIHTMYSVIILNLDVIIV